ncbi:MAG: hypothetical protein M3N24_10530 [Actinomycetota bacterium]|nr:hypothetical protein [Actinomycetota bacterium]
MRHRLLAAAASVTLILVGCGTDERHRGAQRPQQSPAVTPSPQPATLPQIELRADLSERPAPWRLVTSIPFGARAEELGYFFNRERGSLPLLPRSFAVADDESFWILDGVKKRVARFSRTGDFIEEVSGFKLDRLSPRPKDVAVLKDRVYVVEEEFARATLTTIGPERRRVPEAVKDGSHPVALSLLLPSVGRLIARIGGYADPPGTGPIGYGELPLRGRLRLLPGVPVGEGTWVDIRAPGDQDLEFTSTRGAMQAVQPIHVSVFGGKPPKELPALVGPAIEATFHNAVGIYVRVAPARPSHAERFGGGAWYLRLGVDRSPLVWERLPEPKVSVEEQVRHLASGPDGRVYLMVPDEEGVKIYVRRER